MRNQFLMLFDLFRVEVQCAGNRLWLGREIDRVTQVHNLYVFTSIELFLQFLRCNSGDSELTQEFLPLKVFPRDINQ